MSSMITSNLTRETLRKMFAAGKRFDGRGLLDHRHVEISYNVSNKAEGSARVKVGKTEVIAGVKMVPGTPYPDSMEKGNLIVSGDLLPLASPRFESGPPGFEAIELPRLMDRAIRESGMIDLKKLVIEEGKKVWNVYIDVYPLNDDGSLIDAASLACIAALRSAKVPALNKEGNVDYDEKSTKHMPLAEGVNPISFSFFKLGSSLILDPTREEEEACEARVTWGISKWNGQYMINSCQKSAEAIFSQAEINHMMDALPKKFDELNEKLKKFL
ncbi:exosome complex protein Rrp42 [Candidatus Pacearchaeota archaeon]|nr:exosome complex protein Rrp42 [Candidatus Pacearchaeota archaeon]